MPTSEVLINREYKVLLIREEGATGSFNGFEPFDTYNHGDDDPEGWIGNHVDYHHCRDLLYRHGEIWAQDYMIMRAKTSSGTDPIDPLVPGPLDFFIDSARESEAVVPFQMAYSNCLVMLVCYSPIMNRSPVAIEVTHGGEPMALLVQQSYRNHQVSIYKGSGLTTEEANLVIATVNGEPITPIIGRIIDLATEPMIKRSGFQRGYRDNYTVDLSSATELMGKATLACNFDFNLTAINGMDLIAYRRESTGVPISYNPGVSGAWEMTEDGFTLDSPDEIAVIDGIIDGDPDPTHYNGVVMDLTLGESSYIIVRMIGPNGVVRNNATIYGPLNKRIHEMASASGGYYEGMQIVGRGQVTIKNMVVKRDMIALSAAMMHTESAVAGEDFSVSCNISPENYCDLTAISYTL